MCVCAGRGGDYFYASICGYLIDKCIRLALRRVDVKGMRSHTCSDFLSIGLTAEATVGNIERFISQHFQECCVHGHKCTGCCHTTGRVARDCTDAHCIKDHIKVDKTAPVSFSPKRAQMIVRLNPVQETWRNTFYEVEAATGLYVYTRLSTKLTE